MQNSNRKFSRSLVIAWCWLLSVLLSALFTGQALSADLTPIPQFDYVVDNASLFTPEQRQALWDKIGAFEKKTGSQVAVVTVPSLNGEPIESYAHRVGDKWKIGRKGIGDGVLLFVAPKEGELRIDVMRNLEGAIPDVVAYKVMEKDIIPNFKTGNYYKGVDQGLDSIFKLIEAENLPAPAASTATKYFNDEEEGFMYMELVIVVIFMGLGIIATVQKLLGRKGAPVSAILVALVGWIIFGSLIAAVVIGIVSLAFCLIVPNRVLEAGARRAMQLNRMQTFTGRGTHRNPFGSFGRFGGRGSRGGFRGPFSGGGGSSAGGGASGRW